MCSTSSAELAEWHSDSSAAECERRPSAKSNRTADGCCPVASQERKSTTTSDCSRQVVSGRTESSSTPLPAGFHARTSATPDLVPDLPENDLASGLNLPGSLANWDQKSLSWRTSQRCLIEGWERFSGRFPTSGTMQSGMLFPRAPWDSHMCDDECSLWPTPTASMDGRGFGIPLHENTGRYKRSTVLRVHALVKEHGWRIHPNFTEALMGFPSGWSEIEPLEMQLPPTSQRKSGGRS